VAVVKTIPPKGEAISGSGRAGYRIIRAPKRYHSKETTMSNRTFTIIKPDSVRKGNFGKVISRIEEQGFKILGLKKVSLSQKQAEGFYAVHRERPFFGSLVEYMTSGPVYVAALERDNAVAHLRQIMGATDPAKADAGTIRKDFGESIEQNAIHGSDSDENAAIEIGFFFSQSELIG
jgi:nucleoside-diphosphate kinase